MSSFLSAAGGGVTPLNKANPLTVDPMYMVKIYNTKKSIEFTGYVPEDFSIGLSANWTSKYADTPLSSMGNTKKGEILEASANFAGFTTLNKLWTARTWSSPSFLALDLPILLNAYSNTSTEIVKPLVTLLSLCAPSEGAGGILVPPGPSPALAIFEKAGQIVNDTGSMITGGSGVTGNTDSEVGKLLADGEAFTVEIGTFFKAYPMIVTNVNSNFDNIFEDGTGNPINVDFILTVESYFAITREDLIRWFGQAGSSQI